ncbi:MAG: putative bifunctional diguanylate cyclase/phosphodiesterase, partial [Desulfovibrionaceae bacterium]
ASLKDKSGDPVRIAGSNADITERKRAEAALKMSEEHYRAIVDGFEGFIAICDADHRITFMNDRLARRAEGAGLGAACHEVMHGLRAPCPWCPSARVRAGETVRTEIQSPKDQRWYYVVNTPVYHPDGSVSTQSMIQDITESHEAERAMRESEARYRSLIETTSEGYAMLDQGLTVTETNAALGNILGLTREEVLGHSLLEFMDDENQELVQIQANRRADTPHRKYEFAFKRVSGETVNVLASATTMFAADGSVTGAFAFYTDITDRKRMETQLRYQAMHDPLTNLANRTLCLDRISRALERARRRDDYYYALIFLDLDRFKVINDSMGHNFGDQILVEVGHRLMDCVRELDTVSRFGADEFVVLLEELGTPRKAIQVVKRMRQMLRRPFSIDSHEVQLTASIGIVLGPTDFKKPEDILQYANIAMHRAKATGRDRFKVFSTRLLEHAVHLMTLENDMDRALAGGEFFLTYQPIVRLAGGPRLYGFEALARWRHPTRGLIPPDEFIPVAEETGAIMDLGLWVLHQACDAMMQWRRSHPHAEDLVISVNVSGRQFSQHDLANRIRRVLRNTGLPAHQLKLEITETAIMENAARAVEILRQLKDLGVTLSIDDFGTGYSSMSYLQRLPLDNLKIDLSFIQLLDVAPENIEIVKAIINLAHTLKLEVVAEGVERRSHVRILQELGCDFGQGFLYARPLNQEDAERFVAEIDLWKMPN